MTQLIIILSLAITLIAMLLILFLIYRAHRRRLKTLRALLSQITGMLDFADDMERELFGVSSSDWMQKWRNRNFTKENNSGT